MSTIHEMAANRAIWRKVVELEMGNIVSTARASPSKIEPEDPCSAELAGSSATNGEQELPDPLPTVELKAENVGIDRADPDSRPEVVDPSVGPGLDVPCSTSNEDDPIPLWLPSVELLLKNVDTDPSSAKLADRLSDTSAAEELELRFRPVEAHEIESGDHTDRVDPSSSELVARLSRTSGEDELIPHDPSVKLEKENINYTVPTNPSFAKLVGPSRASVEEELILLYHMLRIGSFGTDCADSGSGYTELLAGPSGTSSDSEENLNILPFVKPRIESVDRTEHADPSSTARLFVAGPSGTSGEEELNLPSVDLVMESNYVGSDGDGLSSADLADRPFSTSGEQEALIFPPNLKLRKDSTRNDSGTRTHFCRNGCRFEEERRRPSNSLNVLIQLGCECRGESSWMCVNCLLNWFAPRLLVDKKMKCEICQSLLPESVQKLVLSTYADHTGGRSVFIDVVGARLEMEHERSCNDVIVQERQSHPAWTNIRRYMCCDVNVEDTLPDSTHAGGVPDAVQDASASPLPRIPSTLAQNPAPEAPAPNDQQPRPVQLVWTKIRRYMCYTMPAPE